MPRWLSRMLLSFAIGFGVGGAVHKAFPQGGELYSGSGLTQSQKDVLSCFSLNASGDLELSCDLEYLTGVEWRFANGFYAEGDNASSTRFHLGPNTNLEFYESVSYAGGQIRFRLQDNGIEYHYDRTGLLWWLMDTAGNWQASANSMSVFVNQVYNRAGTGPVDFAGAYRGGAILNATNGSNTVTTAYLVKVDMSSGAATINLPDPAGTNGARGRTISVVNEDNTVGATICTIDSLGSGNICRGAAGCAPTYVIPSSTAFAIQFISDGTDWWLSAQ